MKCDVCGKDFTSQYYFATPNICKECFAKLPPEEQQMHIEAMQNIQFAEPYPYRVGFGRRLGAALLDLFIYYVVFLAVFLFLGVYDQIEPLLDNALANPNVMQEIVSIVLPLTLIISFIYYSMEIFIAATPGKLILGIQIASDDRKPASVGQLFTRFIVKRSSDVMNLLYLVTALMVFSTLSSIVGLIILVGFFFVLAQRKQAFHDMLAKTAVYYRSELIDEDNPADSSPIQ